jgi:hypothetical protein
VSIWSVRPRRRRLRRIVLLQWVVPVFAAEAAVLLVIFFFGRAEYRIPSLVALCAIVAWHVVYAIASAIADRQATRRSRESFARRSVAVSGVHPAGRGVFPRYEPVVPSVPVAVVDPWAGVRDRDD